MNLDVHTLLTLMLGNVFALALALPVVMGWRVSPSARCVMGAAVAQALAWGSFLMARPLHDRLFSTLWMALLCLSFVLMWHALRGWLGPRPGRGGVLTLAVLTPLGYGLGFESYAFRVGWSNFGLALLMILVCVACAWPAPHASRRWRGLILVCLGALAAATAGRGVLGAFFTELYPTLRTPHPLNVAASLLNHVALTLATIGLLVGWHEEADRALRRLADTDGLTGLLNRRAWLQRAQDAMALARRYGHPAAVLLLDIDHFKRINDERGHAEGDRALSLVARALKLAARRGDFACRYGGEEFCLLLSHANEGDALKVDRRVRDTLCRLCGEDLRLTFSSGVAALETGDDDIAQVLRRADEALYGAKAAGRNRAVAAGSATPGAPAGLPARPEHETPRPAKPALPIRGARTE